MRRLAFVESGRLRPCADPDRRPFLIDRSKPVSARWCSQASCGNHLKAHRYYQRTRTRPDADRGPAA
ncbi:CGNR zinc finger domain-containing protein [Streptomyces sp. ODS05-4]|uniref:CGNR zinc finger domain-containing protein n=1 Tax=Streptomyces sp. ODS05-4 TaxID=2944939 RepID=UPI0035B3D891